jgi:type I site-specific restriction-modification system R (restriction) subunit
MYAANILARRHNYPVYIIVDERELVKQFGNELAKIEEISETVIRSDKGKESGSEQLKRVVNSGESGVILSILHLFNELDDEVKLEGTPVVLADEAHRFLGDILGSQMQSTLEPFHYYGYTGTPIEETYEMFSTEDELYLHRYSMSDGVNEGAILPVNMVSKKDKIQWIVNEDQMNEQLEERLKNRPEDQKRRIIYDVMSTQKIAGINSRMDLIVDDIVKHFTTKVRSGGIDYKGMVVTKGKENAAEYGKRLIEELGEDSVDVIYSADNSDSKKVQDFHKDDEEMGDVIDSFKEDKNPKILIVCEMLRTGFDAPILKTIYLDRRFSGGHTLLQTIARTNRPLTVEHEETNEKSEKMYGEIIDYQGITEEFDSLVEYDTAEIEKFTSENKEKFKQEFKEKLNSLNDYFSDELEYNLDESSLNGTEHPVLNEREDIVVVSDGPYSPKDKNLALNLRTALPNSSQIAFTATPIDEINENVMTELFGEASYIMDKEVDDGVTAEIDYEKRTSEINVDDENLNYTEYESDNKVFEKVEHMIKQNERKNKIVDDIISHFNNREIAGKAMLVAYDRETAAHYEDIFRDMAENSDMKVPEVHAIISSPEDYHEKIKRFEKRGGSIRRKGSYPSDMKNYFKDKNSNFDIAIVCDKWTTRFNAEHLHTMYLDKPMRGHNLIQTLSRINRLDDEKESGLVVDYLGIEETVKRVFSDNINEYSQD